MPTHTIELNILLPNSEQAILTLTTQNYRDALQKFVIEHNINGILAQHLEQQIER